MSIAQSHTGILRIGNEDFNVLVGYLRQNFGIDLSKKKELVEGRLNNHILRLGYGDYSSYLKHLFSDKTGEEVSNVINLLTTNYSFFMREFESIRFFKDQILPKLKSTIKDRDLRIWSAGCSTGEEPYTLAMVIDEFLGKAGKLYDKKVLATDISQKVLAKAKNGVFDGTALEQMPAIWKNLHFERLPNDSWKVKPHIQNEVLFRRFNLINKNFPFKKKFHAIFCRNVMIYFNAPTKQALIERFYQSTEEGGYLIIGQSESIDRSKTSYKYVKPSVFVKGE